MFTNTIITLRIEAADVSPYYTNAKIKLMTMRIQAASIFSYITTLITMRIEINNILLLSLS